MNGDANVGMVMLELFEEQAKMFKEHAQRLRKALADSGAQVPPPPTTQADDNKEKGPTKRKRGEKKEKGPKRPLTAFQVYMSEQLKSYRQRHPEVTQKDVMTVISQRWLKLDAEKKAKYVDESNRLKTEAAAATVEGGTAGTGAAGIPLTQPSSSSSSSSSSSAKPTTQSTTSKRKASDGDLSQPPLPVTQPAAAALLETSFTQDEEKKKKKKKKHHRQEGEEEGGTQV